MNSLRSSAGVVGTIRSWADSSNTSTLVRRVERRVDLYADGSGLVHGSTVVTRWISDSWLYGWLTTEPDPDVIVIDLRETALVGPILVALERTVDLIERGTATSLTGSFVQRVVNLLGSAPMRTSRSVRIGIALFAPPNPPEQESVDDREA